MTCRLCTQRNVLLRNGVCLNATRCARRRTSRVTQTARWLAMTADKLTSLGYHAAAEQVREAVRLMSASVHSPSAGGGKRTDG